MSERFLHEVKEYLSKSPDLNSREGIARWFFYSVHAFHLQIIDKTKLEIIQQIIDIAGLPFAKRGGRKCGTLILNGLDAIGDGKYQIDEDERFYSWIGRSSAHNNQCRSCGYCKCGCGLDEGFFEAERLKAYEIWREERKLEQRQYFEVETEYHSMIYELNANQSKFFLEHISNCRSGRYCDKPCKLQVL